MTMTVAEEIRDHQARCQPYLLRLQMIVRGEAEAALTRPVAAEVGQPTNPIIAEAEAAWRAALAAAMPPPERSPRVRLAPLAAAADDAIAAAQDGNSAGLRRNLRRFDALTSGPSGAGRAGGRRAAVGLTGDESPGGAIRAAAEDKAGRVAGCSRVSWPCSSAALPGRHTGNPESAGHACSC
jgi:hypothetical protein